VLYDSLTTPTSSTGQFPLTVLDKVNQLCNINMELSAQKISHDLIEWRSGLEGPEGLLLLLVLM